MKILSQKEKFDRFGDPGDWSNMTDIYCPFPLVIAWDQSKSINRFKGHIAIKDNLENAFTQLLDEYTLDGIKELSINQFGGCYNYRRMRGGTKWSSHAWGIAIDLFPQANGLRTKAPKAAFSHPDYDKMHEIFYDNHFVNYGKEKNYDWMHFEASGNKIY